jgi:hypothetical protein
MAKLRVDKIAASGQITENTGAVFFDGTGDGLRSSPYDELTLGTGAFTIECWFWRQNITDSWGSLVSDNIYSASGGWDLYTQYDDIRFYVGGTGEVFTVSDCYSAQTWTHIAAQRDSSGNFSCYINGIDQGVSATNTTNYSDNRILIGGNNSPAGSYPNYVFNGYISNVRVCKGHNVYTSQFIPPTKELELHKESVFLACYDGENVFAEKTGKIIAANGDRLSSPTPTATDSPVGVTTHNPGLIRSVDATAGPTFQGGVGFVSQNWLTLPKGTTTERNIGSNTRGLIGGGFTTPTQQTQIDLINISTTGNAVSFGDLANTANNTSACSSSTRGLWAGGVPQRNTITFVTIATLGDSVNFGELNTDVAGAAAVSNSTRGIWGGGNINPGTPVVNNIQFVTIATTGDAQNFGDLTAARGAASAVQSTTRGVYLGGRDTGTPDHMNEIDYVTISTLGDAKDFGDLATSNRFGSDGGVSSHVRGVVAGGEIPATTNLIEYITIASTGNSNDFGDLSVARKCVSGTSNKVRGTFSGGENPGQLNAIEYIIIQSMGNAIEFGDMTTSRTQTGSCSDGHGGLE